MLEDIDEAKGLNQCIVKNLQNIIEQLLTSEINFSIFCYLKNVSFEPILPKSIEEKINLKSLTIFTLNGYTFSSIDLTSKNITFEASFGEENFVSIVKVDLSDILQVFIGEEVIFINPFSGKKKKKKNTHSDELAASMQAILSNPKNKNMFQK